MGKVVYLTPALTISSGDLERLTSAIRRLAGALD
jgi:adenosylmethionine-8-amino-7-oxononanoate aminotransferase